MKTFRLALIVAAFCMVAIPAAAGVTYTCDTASFATYAPANECATLNSLVGGVYNSIFSNITANVYVYFDPSYPGIGGSGTALTQIPYSIYYSALAAVTDNPTALNSLPSGTDPLNALGSDGLVDVTPALANSLGLTYDGANNNGITAAGTGCNLSTDTGCYSGIIVLSAANIFYFPTSIPGTPPSTPSSQVVDFFTTIEHETDEVLGTISCIAGGPSNNDQCNPPNGNYPGGTDASPGDLFRYSAPGTRSFLNSINTTCGSPGPTAYFSNDGGTTDIADYNNCLQGGDFGDWVSNYPYLVQDAEASQGVNLDISTDVGVNANAYPQPEVALLNAVGFDLASDTPEPGTMAVMGLSLLILGFGIARRRKTSLLS